MRVEWDERKAEANAKKHGVTFEEAVTALMDAHAITFVDETASERSATLLWATPFATDCSWLSTPNEKAGRCV